MNERHYERCRREITVTSSLWRAESPTKIPDLYAYGQKRQAALLLGFGDDGVEVRQHFRNRHGVDSRDRRRSPLRSAA